jgi:hypothetical protein
MFLASSLGQYFYAEKKQTNLPKAWAKEPFGQFRPYGESIREEHVFWVNLRGQVSQWKSQSFASKKTSSTS